MKNLIKTMARAVAPRALKAYIRDNIIDEYAVKSYSQEGEDLILNRIFEHKKTGFYVDVGAHHPKRFSNTFVFYKRGWRGINIDAMPGSMECFGRDRPRDINVEAAVSARRQTLIYHIFDEPALNGFSESLAASRDNEKYHLINKIPVPTAPLSEILDEHVPADMAIDFMSVDVEGLDLDVLQSNNWEKYRPGVLVVEILESSLHGIYKAPITRFLSEMGYEIYAKSVHSVIFKAVG